MAFTDRSGTFTWNNFSRLWEELQNPNGELRLALRNTLLTFAISICQFPFQVLVSYFLYKKIPGHKVYRVLFFLPGMIIGVASTMILERLLGVNGFIAKGVQEALNLEYAPELLADERFANITVLLHMVWIRFAGALIIWGGTFARIPPEVLEAGRIDGVNWWQEFTKITVPLIWPTVALQMILQICGIFSASGSVFLLTKGQFGTMTLSCWMYLQVYGVSAGYSNSLNYMAAVGVVMSVIAVILSRVVRNMTDKAFSNVEF
jgi:ABC-type sugar transport system permease subunit